MHKEIAVTSLGIALALQPALAPSFSEKRPFTDAETTHNLEAFLRTRYKGTLTRATRETAPAVIADWQAIQALAARKLPEWKHPSLPAVYIADTLTSNGPMEISMFPDEDRRAYGADGVLLVARHALQTWKHNSVLLSHELAHGLIARNQDNLSALLEKDPCYSAKAVEEHLHALGKFVHMQKKIDPRERKAALQVMSEKQMDEIIADRIATIITGDVKAYQASMKAIPRVPENLQTAFQNNLKTQKGVDKDAPASQHVVAALRGISHPPMAARLKLLECKTPKPGTDSPAR